ncbi:MAG: DUF2284 domain-containing protein, partial [bacterium]
VQKEQDEITSLLKEELKKNYPELQNVYAKTDIFVFEERVKLLCFHCAHYNEKWTCPPRIPNLNYEKIIKEDYENALIVFVKMKVEDENFEEVRRLTTNIIHKSLLHLEKVLYDANMPTRVSFIGGSCKLCKNGCAADKCRNPYQARIPLEATGCNLIESFKKVGIKIEFPVKDYLYRYGVILW